MSPNGQVFRGRAASRGVGIGSVTFPHSLHRDGDYVLVAEMTTPDLVMLMQGAKAIVTFVGGRVCHAAIVAREFGVPCVVACREARALVEGQLVRVDGSEGTVELV